jgi:hypothetical protein
VNWIDASSRFQRDGEIDRLLESIQVKSSGCDAGRANTSLSEAYKDETACGLISEGMNLSGDFDPREDVMVCGAILCVNNLEFGVDDRVQIPHELARIERYELQDLSSLKQFVSSYDASLKELRIRNLLPISQLCVLDSLWAEVETEVRSLCLAKVGLDASDLEPEPGFILGLRALTNSLGRLWADRF